MISKNIQITIFSILFGLSSLYSFSLTANLTFEDMISYHYYYDLSFYVNKALAQKINDWSEYSDNSTGIVTLIPSNWEIIKDNKLNNLDQNRNITILKSPKENVDDTFQENIVISVIESKFNVSDSKNIDIRNIIEKLGIGNSELGFDNISIIQLKNSNNGINKTAQSISYSFSNSGIIFKTEQIFLTDKNKFYIFSLMAEQKSFDRYKSVLDQVLNNTRLAYK